MTQINIAPDQQLPQALLFSRGSPATYFDASGLLHLASPDAPRMDHDPVSGEFLGLMIEGPATNLIDAKVDGSSLGLQCAALSLEHAYTLSFYGDGLIQLIGAKSLSATGSKIPGERTTVCFQPDKSGCVIASAAGNVKWAQLETGYVATSFIPDGGTRAGELVELVGAANQVLQGAVGSIVVECIRRGPNYSVGSIVGPSTIGAIHLADYDNGGHARSSRYGQDYFTDAGIGLAFNMPQKIGMAWQAGNHACCVDGYTVALGSDATPLVIAPNYYLGSSGGNFYHMGGWFRSVELFSDRISNQQLQVLCSLEGYSAGVQVPIGASKLGYSEPIIELSPSVDDISPSASGNYALFDSMFYDQNPPDTSSYSMENGVLKIPFGKQVVSQDRSSSPGSLPYLSGANGFYIEFTAWISDNHPDHWPALWLMPQEHNSAEDDHYAPDPAGYERWLEIDVDEGGFTKSATASAIDWQGIWSGSAYYRDHPANTVPGNVTTNYQSSGYLDRTKPHTFGVSYSPSEKLLRYYLDGRLTFKTHAPDIASSQRFYMIAGAQSHGANVYYAMFLQSVRAFGP